MLAYCGARKARGHRDGDERYGEPERHHAGHQRDAAVALFSPRAGQHTHPILEADLLDCRFAELSRTHGSDKIR